MQSLLGHGKDCRFYFECGQMWLQQDSDTIYFIVDSDCK